MILDNTSAAATTGAFANTTAASLYTDAVGDTFLVNYGAVADGDPMANDVALTVAGVVPEPSTWALLSLGSAGWLGWRLRRAGRRALPRRLEGGLDTRRVC